MVEFRHRLPAALLVCLLAGAPVDAAESDDAAGMAIKVSGATTPDLAERTEIPANTTIRLGPGVVLTFLHYRKCRLVTVVGGTLELSLRDYTTDGKIEKEAPGPCPRVYQLPGSAGTVVSRGLPPRLPVDSEIIFAGRRADRVAEAAVYAQDQPDRLLFRFDLANRRATEPAGAAPLAADQRYLLRVRMNDQQNPIEHGFVAIAPGADGSLVVLRIE